MSNISYYKVGFFDLSFFLHDGWQIGPRYFTIIECILQTHMLFKNIMRRYCLVQFDCLLIDIIIFFSFELLPVKTIWKMQLFTRYQLQFDFYILFITDCLQFKYCMVPWRCYDSPKWGLYDYSFKIRCSCNVRMYTKC